MIAAIALLMIQEITGRTRDVVFDPSRPVEIRIAPSDPAHHRTCVITFPEESLETLVASWHEGDLSIERKRDHLFLKLFKPVEGDIHILGSGGTLYRLHVRPADGEPDGQVRIVKPETAARKFPSALELARAMRLGRPPETVAVRRVPDELLFARDRVEARIRWVYEAAHHTGFVVDLSNGGTHPVRIDPRCFAGPDLVLVGVADPVVAPGTRTSLFLVFWR